LICLFSGRQIHITDRKPHQLFLYIKYLNFKKCQKTTPKVELLNRIWKQIRRMDNKANSGAANNHAAD
jgi:hypothetical protein